MKQDLGSIETGSKIAIIGGGPAGSFFALYLIKYAQEVGKHPEITIYEPRNFYEPGHKGCKGCAGILSVSLLRNLVELGFALPEEKPPNPPVADSARGKDAKPPPSHRGISQRHLGAWVTSN